MKKVHIGFVDGVEEDNDVEIIIGDLKVTQRYKVNEEELAKKEKEEKEKQDEI